MSSKIRALIFDIGNVLLPHDYARAIGLLDTQNRATLSEQVEKVILDTRVEYESGRLSRAEFLCIMKGAFEYQGSDERFIEIWCDIFEENVELHLQIPLLAAAYPLYLLSNIGCIHREFIHKRYPVFAHFQGGIYSYEVGCMKPDVRIYQIMSERFGLIPEETLFVDDLPENIEGARAAGFRTFLYDWHQHDLFATALSSYNLLPVEHQKAPQLAKNEVSSRNSEDLF